MEHKIARVSVIMIILAEHSFGSTMSALEMQSSNGVNGGSGEAFVFEIYGRSSSALASFGGSSVKMMKALSLWQPWASLMADNRKPWETRHWPAPKWLIGNEYAIHAAMKVDRSACEDFGYDWKTIPRGAILSIHILKECRLFTEQNILDIEDNYGDFSKGRFGWHSPLIKKFDKPIPISGHQGIWNWDNEFLAKE